MSTQTKKQMVCGSAPEPLWDDEPVIISSYLAILESGCEDETIAALKALEGVEVHGMEYGQLVLTIETQSVDETYFLATRLARLDGIISLSFVHCNFEDETLGVNRELLGCM